LHAARDLLIELVIAEKPIVQTEALKLRILKGRETKKERMKN